MAENLASRRRIRPYAPGRAVTFGFEARGAGLSQESGLHRGRGAVDRIGIGANTAIFSVANAVLLQPLPYAHAERLVILWNRSPGLNIAEDWFSTAQYFDVRNGHHGFEEVAVAIGANQNLTGPFEPERVGVLRVSSNLLPIGTRWWS